MHDNDIEPWIKYIQGAVFALRCACGTHNFRGAGIRQAAEATGLAPSSVSRAWRAEQRPRCPCCGQVIASPRTTAAPAGTD